MSDYESAPAGIGEIEIAAGRVPPPHTPAPDWVTLSGLSDAAQKLHKVLGMHVNRNRGDKKVWPSTRSLAALMGYSRGDKIAPLLRELAEIGAIEIRRVGMPRRNVYLWHSLPPDGYIGPITLKDWYQRNKAALDSMRESDKARRDAAREKAKPKAGHENPQVSPDTPVSGYLADTPKTGVLDTPKRGYLDAPVSGDEEQEEVEPEEVEPPPSPPAVAGGSDVDTAAAADDLELEERVAACVEQVAVDRPEWSKRRIVGAVRTALADRRDPSIVLAAMRLVAADPQTRVPGRLNEDGEWWAAAARSVARPVSAPPVVKVPCRRCGEKYREGAGCPRCTGDGVNGGPDGSEGAVRWGEIDARTAAWLPAALRERLAGSVAGSAGSSAGGAVGS